jgi:UDP-glucose:(heptosyl)LPS alpha-1,3-glucosyltransferase
MPYYKRSIIFLKNHLGGKEGGLEKQTRHLLDAFTKKGCEVSLLTGSPGPFPYPATTTPMPSFLSAHKILAFDRFCKKALSRTSYDIIFGLDRNSFQTHLRAGNGVHRASLEIRKRHEGFIKRNTFALNPLHQLILGIEKKAFENPALQKVFTNSAMVKNQILEHYHIEEKKILVVHNGVEWNEKQKPFENWKKGRQELIEKWDLPKDVFHFLFVGHDFKRKGLKDLLYALSCVKNPDFFLSIIGNDKHEKFYKILARRLGLSDKVRFFGKQHDVTGFYQLADSLVIPSHYDPFANVTIEALASGVFVITSRYNGAHEILQDLTGKVLADTANKESFAAVLDAAMLQPKTEATASFIRNSVSHLDFSFQLPKIIEASLSL